MIILYKRTPPGSVKAGQKLPAFVILTLHIHSSKESLFNMTIVSCPDPAAKAEQKQAHVSYYARALVGQVLLAYDSYFPVSVLVPVPVPVSVSVPVPVPAGFSKIHLPHRVGRLYK